MSYVLQTSNLTKSYNGNKVVDHVDLSINTGDIYGFIGKNGAGKTTFLRMVTGLAKCTEGEIKLFESSDLQFQRKRLGCLIESPALYGGMTARENIEVYRQVFGITDKTISDDILKKVELQDTKNKKARNFSLGMKQRLGIGIALLGNPDFLILDEPINGLDPVGIKSLRELILKINKENNITVLISSHILGELTKIASRYGIINNGKLIDEFTKEELEQRCKCSIKFTVTDVKKATEIIETLLNTTNYDVLQNNVIRMFDYIENPEKISQTLIMNGVGITSLQVMGKDLEGYFMELMEG